jgi:F-type H+-transporting ATPase subunit b
MKMRAAIWGMVLGGVLLFAAPGFAEENQPARRGEPVQATSNQPTPATSESDPNAQFKHSGSVRRISKVTGLSVDGAYWLAVVLNFAVVVVAIVWASKKYLPAVFRNRTASIQRSLEEARRASEDANRRLSDIESRLARLDSEISEMKSRSEKEAAAEEQRISSAAAEDARRIIESAQQEIEAAAKAARRELTAHAADLAVSLASKQIHVDTATDEALLRRFAQQLSTNGVPGKTS